MKFKINNQVDISKIQNDLFNGKSIFGFCEEHLTDKDISDIFHEIPTKHGLGYGGPSFAIKNIKKDDNFIYVDIKYMSNYNGKVFELCDKEGIIKYKLFIENNELLGVYGVYYSIKELRREKLIKLKC
jgi:hypothetical protein